MTREDALKVIRGEIDLCEEESVDALELEDVYSLVEHSISLDRIKEAREEMVNGMPSIRTEGQLTGEDVVFSTACECYAECIMVLDKLIAEVEKGGAEW